MQLWWFGRQSSGRVAQPAWEQVETRLISLASAPGIVELESAHGVGPPSLSRSLQVRGEAGAFLLAEGEEWVDGWLFRIRSPSSHGGEQANPLRSTDPATLQPRSVPILGDRWNAAHVWRSLSLVTQAFRELYLVGQSPRPAQDATIAPAGDYQRRLS